MKKLVQKQIAAMFRHPHHYANAMFLTICASFFGETKITVVGFFWLYALGDNIFDGLDESKVDWQKAFKRITLKREAKNGQGNEQGN